jgi:ArsR family transcriptional regulator
MTLLDSVSPHVIYCLQVEELSDIVADSASISGDDLLAALSALANPQRLRIVAALASGRNYVSRLARELRISRPLLYLHLQKLEAARLIQGHLELSNDGKAMKYYEVLPFRIGLSPSQIEAAVISLSDPPPNETSARADRSSD